MASVEHSASGDRQLRGWKEIALFLGCDERTAKRWEETRGLPIRRMQVGPRSGVFASPTDLNAWLDNAAPSLARDIAVASTQALEPIAQRLLDDAGRKAVENRSEPENPSEFSRRAGLRGRHQYAPALWILLVLVVLAVIVGTLAGRGSTPAVARPSAEAREFYNAGYTDWQSRTPDSLRRAIDEFTQAIVRDPQYAQAYAGLANCYNLLREYTAMPAAYAFPRAKAAAERAIALDPALPDAHAALAFTDFYWSYNSASASREFRRAIALQYNSVNAHHWYAGFLAMHRDFRDALHEIETARALEPHSRSILSDEGLLLFDMGRVSEAANLLRQLEQTAPEFLSPHGYLQGVDLVNGDYDDYLRELSASAEIKQDSLTRALAAAGKAGLARGGKNAMFDEMLKLQTQFFEQGKSDAYSIALLEADIGNTNKAIAYLKLSVSRHETAIVALNVSPEFRQYHDLPAFRQLASQIGMAL